MITTISHDPNQYFDLIFMGDLCPFEGVVSDKLTIAKRLNELMTSSQGNIVNLECPLTSSETRIAKKGPHLKAHPNAIRLLDRLKVRVCNLANNHIRDYGKEGIRETCATLDAGNIDHFGLWGSYGNQDMIMEIKGRRVGLISFTENEFSTDRSEGSAAIGLDCSMQFKQLLEMKEQTDYIIAQYHGGVEFYSYPTPGQQKYCRWLIDAGADLVICHHAHTISGYEHHAGKPIFYGLGNFFFPEAGNQADWYVGLMIGLKFEDEADLTIIPVAYDMQNNTLDLAASPQIQDSMVVINRTIADEQLLNQVWDDYCLTNRDRSLMSVIKPGRVRRLLLKLGFAKSWLQSKADISLLNQLRCESHHERITHTLELINEGRNDRRDT